MLYEGVIFSIDDNLMFSTAQKLFNKYPFDNNYYFMRAKTFTDAVFASAYGAVTIGSATAVAQALADSGAAGAFALATSETGVGAIAGGAVSIEELARAGVLGITSVASKGMWDRSVNILKDDSEKLGSTSISRKELIRNVGDDILDKMENAGGHTIEKHVGLTNQELVNRAMRDETITEAASTFENKTIAIKAIKDSLRKHSKEIEMWLNDPNSTAKILIENEHEVSIGRCVEVRSKNIVYNLTKSRLVLVKDSANELGFKLISAFPIQ